MQMMNDVIRLHLYHSFFSIPLYTMESLFWKHLFSFVTLMIIILKTILRYVLSGWLLINEKWSLTASWREQITSYGDMCFASDQHVWGLFFTVQGKCNKNKVRYAAPLIHFNLTPRLHVLVIILYYSVFSQNMYLAKYRQFNSNLLWCETFNILARG